ncbi:MAG: hypothetical protein CFE25_10580 [Chitinophagaceae bacterium BSSC1]|nr:MAG: hypothetical protein CFE25_10580 [Chitinophagaceae bacterium BSSC1]HQS04891.1 hypothetical protein [Daejeonella sp.]
MGQIIQYLIGVSGFTLFFIWVSKLIITKSFDLGLENYKSSLLKDLEIHKSELSKVSLEHQVKFTKLHDDRAEKIKILYGKVIELESALIFATTVAQGPEYSTDNQRDEECFEKIRSLIRQLDLDRIYFTEETISKFDTIIKESWEISFQMRKVRRFSKAITDFSKIGQEIPLIYYSETDLWSDANERAEKGFKILKEDLANEFRKLLGI